MSVAFGRCSAARALTSMAANSTSKYGDAKSVKGFGSGVFEVLSDHHCDTFLAVYTVRFAKTVYVLHTPERPAAHRPNR